MYVIKTPNKSLKSPISDADYAKLRPTLRMFYIYRSELSAPTKTQTIIKETTIVQNNSDALEDLLFGNIVANSLLDDSYVSPDYNNPVDDIVSTPDQPVQFGGGDFGGAGSSGTWDDNSTRRQSDNQVQDDYSQQSNSDNSSSNSDDYSQSSQDDSSSSSDSSSTDY